MVLEWSALQTWVSIGTPIQSSHLCVSDRDGTMDMVFPTCESVSVDGFGVGCSINIAYNQQRPVCTSTGTFSTG